jgi:hypothetical protein
VTFWSQVFLGTIAVSTLLMALIQVGMILYGWALARRVSRLLERLEQDVKPIIDNLSLVARDASRASSLAVAQVERVDKLFTDLTARVEQTAETVQRAVLAPLRDGAALMAGLKAALGVLRDLSPRGRGAARTDDEEALFIG